jgi:uncharacterized membrane protein
MEAFREFFKVLAGIVTLGVITVIVASPHVAKDIESFFKGFGYSISAAEGAGSSGGSGGGGGGGGGRRRNRG